MTSLGPHGRVGATTVTLSAAATLALPITSLFVTSVEDLVSRWYQAWVESVNPRCTVDAECYSFLAEDFARAATLFGWSVVCFVALGVTLGAIARFIDGGSDVRLCVAATIGLFVGSLSRFVDPTDQALLRGTVLGFIFATAGVWLSVPLFGRRRDAQRT